MSKLSPLYDLPLIARTVDGGICLSMAGIILSHEEARNILDELERFYATHTPQELEPDIKNDMCKGYVYLISREKDSLYKIGTAVDVQRRMERNEKKQGQKLTVVHLIPCKNKPTQLERYLHRKYHSKHVRYDWFALSSEDVEWIKTLEGDG